MGDQSPDEALRKDANSFDCIQLKIYMRKQQWLIFIEHLIYTCYGFFFFFFFAMGFSWLSFIGLRMLNLDQF